MSNFGIRLKKLGEEKGISLQQLSEISSCHFLMLRDWESGKRVLTIGIILKLSKLFNVTTDYLLGL